MRFVLITFFTIIFNYSYSQNVEDKINSNVKFLRSKKIDTFLLFYNYAYSYNHTFYKSLNCKDYLPIYLFWKKGKFVYVKKIDRCSNYDIIKYDSLLNSMYSFFLNNLEEIEYDSIIPPSIEYYDSLQKKYNIISPRVSHSLSHNFHIYIQKKEILKEISDYLLEVKNMKGLNTSYVPNHKSKLYNLYKLVESDVSIIDSKFKKIKL